MTNEEVYKQFLELSDNRERQSVIDHQEIRTNMERILNILESDAKTKEPGLVERVRNSEEALKELKEGDIKDLNIFRRDVDTKIKIGGAIGGTLATGLVFFIKWLFKI